MILLLRILDFENKNHTKFQLSYSLSYRDINFEIYFNILLQNLMRVEHFESYILKLIKKLISWKLIDQFN